MSAALQYVESLMTGWRQDGLELTYHHLSTLQALIAAPIPMILFCPACGTQHIDRDQAEWIETYHSGADREYIKHRAWVNKPHKSHLCLKLDGGCGHIWRPADVPTEGVAEIATKGADDHDPIRQSKARHI
jgi:hypothetical protein